MKWTKKEIEFLLKNYTKIGSKKCSEQLNRTQGSTIKKAYELGIKSFKFHKPIYEIIKKCLCCGNEFKQKIKNEGCKRIL